ASMINLITTSGAFISDIRAGMTSGGYSLTQLRLFGSSLGSLFVFTLSGAGVFTLRYKLSRAQIVNLIGVYVFVVLSLLTVRTSVILNYQNFDLATEFMVYAHGTPDIKIALQQIHDISWAVTGTPHDVKVAYGDDGSWPLTWYMVDYPNNYFYGTSPNEEILRDYPVIIAGTAQYTAVEEIIGNEYIPYDYKYLWWPIQDYYNLSVESVKNFLQEPSLRKAIWDIVWKRDYTSYAEYKNPDTPFTLQKWPYRKEFRLYVKKSLAKEVWSYKLGDVSLTGINPAPTQLPDPFRAGEKTLERVGLIQLPGAVLRGLEQAQDGSVFAADTANHRIWHIDSAGNIVMSIGEYGVDKGQLIEPWDVAVDENGFIYVADTWNHRIQKFDRDGNYVTHWGVLTQVSGVGDPAATGAFYGPRGIAYDGEGELFVTDTGNKRVQVFDLDGQFLREFGGHGSSPGLLDEPVGIDIASDGSVIVVDSWNTRMQSFTQDGIFLREWAVPVWDMYNPDEKPFVAFGSENIYVSDPVRSRILVFDKRGQYRWALSADAGAEIKFPQGMVVIQNMLWVADAHEGNLYAYRLSD
ncbi:MAG: hypothetical protein P1S60_16540, partial [Anaerolineae bacterium]|nr:hypothetical protein [Anaerolineae bacterium]